MTDENRRFRGPIYDNTTCVTISEVFEPMAERKKIVRERTKKYVSCSNGYRFLRLGGSAME